MKEKILEIIDKLKLEQITPIEAQKQLLCLFGVVNMLRRLKNYAEIHSYPSKSFKQQLRRFIRNYC